MKMTLEKLNELRAKNLPHATVASVGIGVTVKDGETAPEAIELCAKLNAELDVYYHHFTPMVDHKCIGCGERLVGKDMVEAYILGCTFTWGLAHGEGYCAECGYPARAIHFIKFDNEEGSLKFQRVLQYHPSELKHKDEEKKPDEVHRESSDVRDAEAPPG